MAIKVGASVKKDSAQGLVESVKWIISPEFAANALGIERIKARLLKYLQRIFPRAEASERRKDRRYRPHLVTGFRTYDIPGSEGKRGFVLKHRNVSEPFTRRLLASLEKGSRAYVQKLGDRKVFSFHPGDGRGERHSKGGQPDFASLPSLRIPARKGGNYMQRVYTEARRLLAEAKPTYFKKAKDALKNRKRK